MKKIIQITCFVSFGVLAQAQNEIVQPIVLPSQFIAGERFYLLLQTDSNKTLLGYCDTGGGLSFIMPPAIDEFKLAKKLKKGFVGHLMKFRYLEFKDVVKDVRIPPPVPTTNFTLRKNFKIITDSVLLAPKMNGETRQILAAMPMDVFFGQNFFMHHAWTFDYPNQQIILNTPLTQWDDSDPNMMKVGFRKDENGHAINGHPSFQMEVDSEKIDVLFDTGATIILSDSGRKALGTNEPSIGGSFIAKSVMIRWHQKHADWRIISGGDHGSDMMMVPIVKIGNHSVGPVWFAVRNDEVWSQWMIHTMDKVVKGAIGGSALKYLKVTIDYNSELIRVD